MASAEEIGRYVSELEIVLHYVFARMARADLEAVKQDMDAGLSGRGWGPRERRPDAIRFVEREIERRRAAGEG